MESYFKMLSQGTIYNQNAGFHTGIYGWSYNAAIFIQFAIFKFLLQLDTDFYYPIYALAARMNSFLYSLAALIAFYFLAQRLFRHAILSFGATFCFLCFFPFILHSYQIHPEPAGIFWLIIAFHFFYNWLKAPEKKGGFLGSIFFASLSFLAKPPFGVAGLCMVFYFMMLKTNHGRSQSFLPKLKVLILAGLIFIITAFIVHPYMFIDFKKFLGYINWIYTNQHGTVPDSVFVNCRNWFSKIFLQEYIILCGMVSSLICLALFRFKGDRGRHMFCLLSLYNLTYLFGWLIYYQKDGVHIRYTYPVYPFLILVAIGLARYLFNRLATSRIPFKKVFAPLLASVIFSVFTLASAYNLLTAVCSAGFQKQFSCTHNFWARNVLFKIGKKPWRVVYSPSLPLPPNYYITAEHFYSFPQEGTDLIAVLQEDDVQAFIIDQKFWNTNLTNKFSDAASRMGFKNKYAITNGYPQDYEYSFINLFDAKNALAYLKVKNACATGSPLINRDDIGVIIWTQTPLPPGQEAYFKKLP